VVEPTGIDPRNTATAADLITLGALAMGNENAPREPKAHVETASA
jgi:hypothetical protein